MPQKTNKKSGSPRQKKLATRQSARIFDYYKSTTDKNIMAAMGDNGNQQLEILQAETDLSSGSDTIDTRPSPVEDTIPEEGEVGVEVTQHSDESQNGLMAIAPPTVPLAAELEKYTEPIKRHETTNPGFEMLLDAMKDLANGIDKKLETIISQNTEWKTGVTSRLTVAESSIGENKAEISKMKEVVDFMEAVANNTNSRSQSVDKSLETIFAQLEIDRLSSLRAQFRLEERINVLDREVKSFNIRVQGLKPTASQNLKTLVVDTFAKVVPELRASHIEYVAKIAAAKKKATTTEGDDGGEGVQNEETARAEKNTEPSVILLIRFTDKLLRNKVYAMARKDKVKLGQIIVRDDLVKADYEAWTLAKPQMKTAYSLKQRSRCKDGKLNIESKQIPIKGLKSTDAMIHEINQSVKIPFKLPRAAPIVRPPGVAQALEAHGLALDS